MINIKSFGVLGNGQTDDTLGIQAAIDSITQPQISNLFFPSGQYRVTSPILVNKNIQIVGEGYHSAQIIVDHNAEGIILDGRNLHPSLQQLGVRNITMTTGGEYRNQTLISAPATTNLFLSDLYLTSVGRLLKIGSPDQVRVIFNTITNIRGECYGSREAIKLNSGGGVINNCVIRKGRTSGHTGPTIHMTGQLTSLQVSNSIFSGLGTPEVAKVVAIENFGTYCRISVATPLWFGIKDEPLVIKGSGTTWDGVYKIRDIINGQIFHCSHDKGPTAQKYVGQGAEAYKAECTLYMDSMGNNSVNETSWSNVLFEGVDERSMGSAAVHLNAINGPHEIIAHNFGNCFFDSGETSLRVTTRGNLVREILVSGGNARYYPPGTYLHNLGGSNIYFRDVNSMYGLINTN